ncbi:hypothetical protein [Methylobacterium sp. 37f]|uniref:hypothetical protein n=1 Tax=Methylobacterium sp. 37f TaxID=2817058 RepID=UPI001FFD3364|nr:hypothetical protein [Methylobacterium sp. 37f]MCK2055464.1 hypothetical protein [Methylobacterium sp. 37f]
MKIAINGAGGRIGRTLVAALRSKHDMTLLDKDEGCNLAGLNSFDAVIHLAVDFTDAQESIEMLAVALKTADTPRFIYASSVTVDPHSGVDEADKTYVQAKKDGEAMVYHWLAGKDGSRAIALRFGHFHPGSVPPHEHEAVRLTENGLVYWVERALSDEPQVSRLTVWTATGNGG